MRENKEACDRTGTLLFDYLDGALNEADREAVEKHLAVCADCRRMMEDDLAVFRAVRSAAPRPSDDFTQRVMERIRAEEAAPAAPRKAAFSPRRWGGLAAAFVLLVGVAIGSRTLLPALLSDSAKADNARAEDMVLTEETAAANANFQAPVPEAAESPAKEPESFFYSMNDTAGAIAEEAAELPYENAIDPEEGKDHVKMGMAAPGGTAPAAVWEEEERGAICDTECTADGAEVIVEEYAEEAECDEECVEVEAEEEAEAPESNEMTASRPLSVNQTVFTFADVAIEGKMRGGHTLENGVTVRYAGPEGLTVTPTLILLDPDDPFPTEGYYLDENTQNGTFVGFGTLTSVEHETDGEGREVMTETVLLDEATGEMLVRVFVRLSPDYALRMAWEITGEADRDACLAAAPEAALIAGE